MKNWWTYSPVIGQKPGVVSIKFLLIGGTLDIKRYPKTFQLFRPIWTRQEAGLPFPWSSQCERAGAPHASAKQVGSDGDGVPPIPKRRKMSPSNSSNIADLPWYDDLCLPCQSLNCISFHVPKHGSMAGSVLKHSLETLDWIFRKNTPCIYKFGWTHNPAWRWSNPCYGYERDRDGWAHMVILFVSHEPYTPAMLEAALIHKYFGNSDGLLILFGNVWFLKSPIDFHFALNFDESKLHASPFFFSQPRSAWMSQH